MSGGAGYGARAHYFLLGDICGQKLDDRISRSILVGRNRVVALPLVGGSTLLGFELVVITLWLMDGVLYPGRALDGDLKFHIK